MSISNLCLQRSFLLLLFVASTVHILTRGENNIELLWATNCLPMEVWSTVHELYDNPKTQGFLTLEVTIHVICLPPEEMGRGLWRSRPGLVRQTGLALPNPAAPVIHTAKCSRGLTLSLSPMREAGWHTRFSLSWTTLCSHFQGYQEPDGCSRHSADSLPWGR